MLYKSTLGGYMDKKLILMRIEQLMTEKGITKYQLRENAEISSTIYQWKKNATRDKFRVPSLRSIEKICDYLDVSLSYFFAFDIRRCFFVYEIARSDISQKTTRVEDYCFKEFNN